MHCTSTPPAVSAASKICPCANKLNLSVMATGTNNHQYHRGGDPWRAAIGEERYQGAVQQKFRRDPDSGELVPLQPATFRVAMEIGGVKKW
jgi:hypothetical protein